jgi:pyruvate,water dikinase
MKYIVDLSNINLSDVARVGGKNASTGEMIQNLSRKGIHVPGGFATTVEAYQQFLHQNDLGKKIGQALSRLKIQDINALQKTSQQIRRWIVSTPFFPEFENEIAMGYAKLKNAAVAVRSSATTEDLANASFAGQQESYLNIKGIRILLPTIKLVARSLIVLIRDLIICNQPFPLAFNPWYAVTKGRVGLFSR